MNKVLRDKLEQLISDYNLLKEANKGVTKETFGSLSQEDKIKAGAINFRVTMIPGEFILIYELIADNYQGGESISKELASQYYDFKETLGNFVTVKAKEIIFDDKIKRFIDNGKG